MTTAERIQRYLAEVGWSKTDLARRAKISGSTVTRLLHGRKDRDGAEPYELGELVAMKIERATLDAFTRGETSVAPLRAIDLCQSPAQHTPSMTGTEG